MQDISYYNFSLILEEECGTFKLETSHWITNIYWKNEMPCYLLFLTLLQIDAVDLAFLFCT